MSDKLTGLIVVPVYNEADNLPPILESLRGRFPMERVLFVDDGSRDGSHRILERAGVQYLRHPINLGYEESLRTGMDQALRGNHRFVAFFDSDGQHRAEDLDRIIELFETGNYDLIVGSRYKDAENIPLTLRSFTTRLFSLLTTILAGVKITDVTCGLKLISRRFIPPALKLPTEDMHAEFIVGLSRCGARIHEEKITVMPREAGDSMYHFYKSLVYPAKTFVCLAGELVFYRRLRSEVGPAEPKKEIG